jgi:hypothetical protein
MASRTYPNDYFAWFNDDQRLAILCLDTTSTTSSERTTEKYDTFQGTGNLSGTISDLDGDGTTATATCSAAHGLVTDDRVTVSGTTSYDGDYSITVSGGSTTVFTFSDPSDGSSDNESGTFTSLFIDGGIRITYKSKFETVTAVTEDLDDDIGLDTGLQPQLVCYMKSRLYEDQGNFEQANYFRQMYEGLTMKQRSRKSGVRGLSVPNL